MQDDYATALQYYGRVDHGGQAIEAVMHQSAMLSKLGHLGAARQQLQSLRDNFPQFAPRFTLAEAELLLNAQKYDDALDVLDVALKDQPDDADLLYSRSLVYERMNKIDAAEKDLSTRSEERRVGNECIRTCSTR